MENPILKIDFTTLRSQKTTLLETIDFLEKSGIKWHESVDAQQIVDDLTGILHLIDSIQDYAVDELGVPEIHVYDFELEEERDLNSITNSPEEEFARQNAENIFQIHIEGTCLFDEESNGGMPRDYIEKIVDDPLHMLIIKDQIRRDILNDLRVNPDNFDRDENGKLTYDATMYDYGFAIEEYCKANFNLLSGETVQKWCCSECGSQNVEIKKWVNANTDEVGTDCEDEYGWCPDCDEHHEVELKTFDLNGKEIELGTTDGQTDPNK
jgi:hypothetical protein